MTSALDEPSPGEGEALIGQARFARTRFVSVSRSRLVFHLLLPRCARGRNETGKRGAVTSGSVCARERARPISGCSLSPGDGARLALAQLCGSRDVEVRNAPNSRHEPLRCLRCLRWLSPSFP